MLSATTFLFPINRLHSHLTRVQALPVRCFPGLFHKPIPAFTTKPTVLRVCPYRRRRDKGRSAPKSEKGSIMVSHNTSSEFFPLSCSAAPIPAGFPVSALSHNPFPHPPAPGSGTSVPSGHRTHGEPGYPIPPSPIPCPRPQHHNYGRTGSSSP